MNVVGAALTVILNGAELTEPKPFIAERVIGPKTPATDGTPESKPFEPFRVSPVGNVPDTRLNDGAGEPFAANV